MIYKLGDLIDIKHGFAFSGSGINTIDNGIVLVTPGNFKIGGGFKEDKCKFFHESYPNEYVLKAGDLIVTMTDLSKAIDTLGYSAIVPNNSNRIYLHNQRIGLVIKQSDLIDYKYLYWLLRSPSYQKTIAGSSTGSTVHHTSPGRIKDFEFELPNLFNQKKISSILDMFEKTIELNQKQIKTLESLGETIYRGIFVNFDNNNGSMPSGWKVVKLSDFVNVITGKQNADVADDEGEYPFFSCSQDAQKCKQFSFEGRAVLVAGNGDFNVKFYTGKFEAYQRTYVLIPNNAKISSLIFYALKFGLKDITSAARGSVIKFITKGSLDNFTFNCPVDFGNNTHINLLNFINDKIEKLRAENETILKMEKIIMPKLFSGSLDLSNINIEE